MFKEEIYRVHVGGERGSDAVLGTLEPGSATIKGQAIPTVPFRGDEYIPNRTIVWGRRLIAGKPKTDAAGNPVIITVNEPGYLGEIEFLKYGTLGGHPIELRFLESSPSLDYDFQVLKLGFPKHTDEAAQDFNYLALEMGVNEIDTRINPNKASFLKVHHLNVDSEFKLPGAMGQALKDVLLVETSDQKVKDADKKFEAGRIVREANSYEKLEVLLRVVNHNSEVKHTPGDPSSVFDGLKLFADSDPVAFLSRIDQYKVNVSNLLEKAKTFKAIDSTSIPGSVTVGQETKELIMENIPGKLKGDKALEWMLSNCLEPEVAAAIKRLEIISQNFK